MVFSRMLLLASLLAAVSARPQAGVQPLFGFAPSPVYSYRFSAPEQTKQESRDALGNIQGSYSVTYPNGGGSLTYSYAHPARQPAFRTTSDGPLGPAGTIIAINSKDNAFLIEMLEQRLDSRDPPIVTKTDAVLIEALPLTQAGVPLSSVRFQAAGQGQSPAASSGAQRPNQVRLGGSLTRDTFINSKESAIRPGTPQTFINSKESAFRPGTRQTFLPGTRQTFINSKESAFLPDIRQESLENEVLGARNPPIVTKEEIIVEAAPDTDISDI